MPPAVDAQPPAEWLADLQRRHFADLRFAEVSRALRALSSTYVERRQTALAGGRALDGAGKRAAFALYFGPLHFMATTTVLAVLTAKSPVTVPGPIVDLGCGTGAVGAAAATWLGARAITGIDTHPWALDEARHTYAAFGLTATLRRGSVARFRPPRPPAFIVAGYVANELSDAEREALVGALAEAARAGCGLLVLEPLARAVAPWWPAWAAALAPVGVRADEWKVGISAPDLVRRLGTAAGLTTTVLSCRSLFRPPG